MSGLYLIGIVALWLWLTWLLLRFEWRILVREKNKGSVRAALVGIVILAWLGASLWYGGGRKYYYDWRVNQACAVDGGVKIYETILLSANEFDNWGMIKFYKPNKGKDALGSAYEFYRDTDYVRRERPTVVRFHTRVIRRSDAKLLGESVFYKRGGGDLPGPWHGSSYMCPELSVENEVLRQIFVKE